MVTKVGFNNYFQIKLAEVNCDLSDLVSVLLEISK